MAGFLNHIPENDWTYEEFLEVKRMASEGEPHAMNQLGLFHMFGQFVEQDETKALYWFEEAGKMGVASAQWAVGDIYRHGTDEVPVNPEMAARWFRYAAHTEPSGRNLRSYGECLDSGFGVLEDKAEAAEYYSRAVEKNDSLAFFRLGVLYLWGKGVSQDPGKGLGYIYTAKMRGIGVASEYWDKLDKAGMLKGIEIKEKDDN